MKEEKEITVLVNVSYLELNKELIDKGFNIIEEYVLNDDYMIDSKLSLNSLSKLDILKKCILVREIVGIKKVLLYKNKEYSKNGDIIKQGKIECPITDIDKAISFMESIDYKHLFKIYDKCIVYTNDKTEIVVQLVNDKYIFIEMEDKAEHINKKYETIEEMIKELDSYNLPYNKDNYFVKKAELILSEVDDEIK